jgi:hypothetical protein
MGGCRPLGSGGIGSRATPDPPGGVPGSGRGLGTRRLGPYVTVDLSPGDHNGHPVFRGILG